MISFIPPLGRNDKWGSGEWGAPREYGTHNGEDIPINSGSIVLSNVAGRISKFGYAYSDDLSFRYVEVTNLDDLRFRFFYVMPLDTLAIGDFVGIGYAIGITQSLEKRYAGITPHVHFEVKDIDGNYLNPNDFL